jgi:hypothetical protein
MADLEPQLLPRDLLDAVRRAREIRQLDTNYSNGSGPYSPTIDHLNHVLKGVEDDPTVTLLIQHHRIVGNLPPE